MSINFVLSLLVWFIVCAIVYLIGTAVIRKLGLGEPWPTVLWLLVALLIIIGVIMPMLGYVTVRLPAP